MFDVVKMVKSCNLLLFLQVQTTETMVHVLQNCERASDENLNIS